MKQFKLMFFFLVATFATGKAVSQNVLINILTQNTGIVRKGKEVFLEVTVNNTDPVKYIGIYKIKPQISVPAAIVSIASRGHVLPTGWEITDSNDSTITLTNGRDMIAATDARTLLIALHGNKIGGPLTVLGQLTFSDGNAPGIAPGVLKDDNPADNSSTSTCKVVK
jgi:hypothetical protein